MKMQRGGFVLGMVVGLLIGLALALGVALYVTKVPVPFIDKVPQRTAEQDAAEAQKNRGWDPNAPLAGKPAAPAAAASGVVTPGAAGGSTRDPAALLAGAPARPAASAAAGAPGAKASGAASAEAFIFFVQVGAFQKLEDAEAQRAKLGLQGTESRLVEREQAGRTVYRVRVGPYERQAEAETAREKLNGAGFETVLVRVERPAQ
jgi:cell division protein FtsN